jgi:uncharacterized membrane protein
MLKGMYNSIHVVQVCDATGVDGIAEARFKIKSLSRGQTFNVVKDGPEYPLVPTASRGQEPFFISTLPC